MYEAGELCSSDRVPADHRFYTARPMDLSTIFKAYDVRGLAPQQLDRRVAVRIGAAFAQFADASAIAVGYD